MNQDLKNILHNIKNVKVLEQISDPKQVVQYFSAILKYRKEKNLSQEQIQNLGESLLSPQSDLEQKRKAIILLAGSEDLKARKFLEQYAQQPDPELKDWINIALQENAVLLQSAILGEPQILISSGLGGKDDKIRFFVLFYTKDLKPLQPWQKDLIAKETKFFFENNNILLEKLDFGPNYFTILALFPFELNIYNTLRQLLDAINEFGDFLDPKFIVRNDQIIPQEQIQKILSQIQQRQFKEQKTISWEEVKYLFDIDKDTENHGEDLDFLFPDDDDNPDPDE